MNTSRWLICALIGAGLMLVNGTAALAQPGPGDPPPADGEGPPPPPEEEAIPEGLTPEGIADWCVGKATEWADRCVEANAYKSESAVAIIEILLANDEPELALQVGRWAGHVISDHSRRCGHRIHHLCRHCRQVVIRAGGSRELVAWMVASCEEQVERVRESRRVAIAAIHEALADVLPEEPVDPALTE